MSTKIIHNEEPSIAELLNLIAAAFLHGELPAL
jgi:hypothetical protein